MTVTLCARESCAHPAQDHSGIAGCLNTEDGGYCACPRLITHDAPVRETTDQGEAFPTPGGATYVEEIDGQRLNRQQAAVYHLMKDGRFRTLREIADATGYPEASVSARLRDLRKRPLNRDVQRRRRTEQGGTWEYRVVVE